MDGEMTIKDVQDDTLDLMEILSCLRHRNVCKPRERMALDIVIKDLHKKVLDGDEVPKETKDKDYGMELHNILKIHDVLKRVNDIGDRLTVIEEKINKSKTSKVSAKKCKHHYFGKLHINPSTSFITPASRVNYNYKDPTLKEWFESKRKQKKMVLCVSDNEFVAVDFCPFCGYKFTKEDYDRVEEGEYHYTSN